MTFIEYRMQRAAIVARHRTEQAAELAELDANYSAEDKTLAMAARAKRARDARAAHSTERRAREYLSMWGANPRLFARTDGSTYTDGRLDTVTAAERTEMQLACTLSEGRYIYGEANGLYRVTQIVT